MAKQIAYDHSDHRSPEIKAMVGAITFTTTQYGALASLAASWSLVLPPCPFTPNCSVTTLACRLSEDVKQYNDDAQSRPFPFNFTLHHADPAIMDTSISV